MIFSSPFDINDLLSKEYLFTNVYGGYCSSTLSGIRTRSYHGLFVSPVNNLRDRIVMLSDIEEQVYINGRDYFLSSQQYENTIYPTGYTYLAKIVIREDGIDFLYDLDGRQLIKKLSYAKHDNKLVISYIYEGSEVCYLKLFPLIAFRSYHTVAHAPFKGIAVHAQSNRWTVTSDAFPSLSIIFSQNIKKIREQETYYNFRYTWEERRGLAWKEDLLSPFGCEVYLQKKPFTMTIESSCEEQYQARARVEQDWIEKFSHLRLLYQHADDFVFQLRGKPNIMAGYHWFTYWGRDTLISLPGLLLATGRFEEAKELLRDIIAHQKQGLLFNVAEDGSGNFQYHSVDASLLYVYAFDKYIMHTNDLDLFKELKSQIREMLDHFVNGTEYNIYLDKNFLLHAGSEGKALTWMDACNHGHAYTPRRGYPVEINALFYNALCVFDFYCEQCEQPTAYHSIAPKIKMAFEKYFWNGSYCYDVISKQGMPDLSLRPNQLFACGLRFPLIDRFQAQSMVKVIQEHLVTMKGLRTLSPDDPHYAPHYEGDPARRDAQYHQGTVWPWLFGIYADALHYAFGENNNEMNRLRLHLDSFIEYCTEQHLGLVPEIFDAQEPFCARGCIHQAWSTAEILRVYHEYFYGAHYQLKQTVQNKKHIIEEIESPHHL